MKCLFVEFENEQYWIEVSGDGYALRQIIIDEYMDVHISCLEDCLTEGKVNENELDGIIKMVPQIEFDKTWSKVTAKHRSDWKIQKAKYPIEKEVLGRIEYYYPQGWIIKIDHLQGICKCESDVSYDQLIGGKVIGYDETNMRLVISQLS